MENARLSENLYCDADSVIIAFRKITRKIFKAYTFMILVYKTAWWSHLGLQSRKLCCKSKYALWYLLLKIPSSRNNFLNIYYLEQYTSILWVLNCSGGEKGGHTLEVKNTKSSQTNIMHKEFFHLQFKYSKIINGGTWKFYVQKQFVNGI